MTAVEDRRWIGRLLHVLLHSTMSAGGLLYGLRMTEGRGVPDEAELAARFREIANRTAWSLDDDAEDVLVRLRVLHTEMNDLVTFDEVLDTVVASDALLGFYGYAASLGKSIDVSARGRLPEHQGISHADHLDEIRSKMPRFHAELQDRLAELNRPCPLQ